MAAAVTCCLPSAHRTRLQQESRKGSHSSLTQARFSLVIASSHEKPHHRLPIYPQRKMADIKPPPSYDDAAIQHGALPARPAGTTNPVPRGLFLLDIPVLNQLRGKRCILASASPRRKQILSTIGLNLEVLPSTKPENLSKEELGPFEYVLQTALQKALDVYQVTLEQKPASVPVPDPSLVIGADTVIVTSSGLILEKPRSQADHIRMLKLLRDQKVHRVFTAVAVIAPREDARFPGYNTETVVEETKVVFDEDMRDDLIEAYVRTREGVDKAGGYGLQGLGSLLVERIEGASDNVVGLPLRATLRCIERAVLRQGDDGSEEGEEDEEE